MQSHVFSSSGCRLDVRCLPRREPGTGRRSRPRPVRPRLARTPSHFYRSPGQKHGVPIVYCPYLWDNAPSDRPAPVHVPRSRDADGSLLDVVRNGTPTYAGTFARGQRSAGARILRHLYVALTRAKTPDRVWAAVRAVSTRLWGSCCWPRRQWRRAGEGGGGRAR